MPEEPVPGSQSQPLAQKPEEEPKLVAGPETPPAAEAAPDPNAPVYFSEAHPVIAEGEEEPKAAPPDDKPKEEVKAAEEVKIAEPHKPTRAERSISKLTWQREEAKREKEYWKAVAEGKITAPPVTQAPETSTAPKFDKPEPQEDDYDSIAKHIAAVVKWELAKEKFENAHQQAQEQAKTAAEQQLNAHQQTTLTQVQKGMVKYPDFNATCNELDEVASDQMVKLLFKSPVFEDLAYHFGKNLDEAERISALTNKDDEDSQNELIYEIKTLEKRFKSSNPPPTPQPAPNQLNPAGKRTTQAPPPVPRAGGNEKATVPLENEDYAGYVKRVHPNWRP